MIDNVRKGARYRGAINGEEITVVDIREDVHHGFLKVTVVYEDRKGRKWWVSKDVFCHAMLEPV